MSLSSILVGILCTMCLCILYKSYYNKDKTIIWSPITFLTLTIIYYWILPEFFTSREFEGYNVESRSLTFHLGAIISYISILIGFFFFNRTRKKDNWKHWNSLFSENSSYKFGLFLFIFAMICHVPFRGLHFSFLSDGTELAEYDYSSPGLSYYFVNMVAILCMSCCLLIPKLKEHKLLFGIILWMTLVVFIVAGFRYRIVILVISIFTVYHLYNPIPKKIKLIPVLIIAYICYTGFNIMDHSRDYGNGIRLDVISSIEKKDVTAQAGETERVYNYSIMVMDTYYNDGKREYFDPLITAFFMPIPRAIFPWKPDANYLTSSANYVMKGGTASAYVNFVEAFMAFGWLGIVINGIFIGWLSKRFWNNYRNNPKSIGAIIALAIYNGFTYVIISRGYLAQEYSCFLFYICIPFWISRIIKRFIIKI